LVKKRIAGLAALTAAATVALVLPTGGASARPGDAKGPLCSDIHVVATFTSATGTPGETGTVQWTLTTPQAPSCPGATYTVTVFDATGTTILGGAQYTGNGEDDAFAGSLTIEDAPASVCVSATSTVRGRLTDAAPDTGCEEVELDDIAPGGGGFD
jgi:hypothetical protein